MRRRRSEITLSFADIANFGKSREQLNNEQQNKILPQNIVSTVSKCTWKGYKYRCHDTEKIFSGPNMTDAQRKWLEKYKSIPPLFRNESNKDETCPKSSKVNEEHFMGLGCIVKTTLCGSVNKAERLDSELSCLSLRKIHSDSVDRDAELELQLTEVQKLLRDMKKSLRDNNKQHVLGLQDIRGRIYVLIMDFKFLFL